MSVISKVKFVGIPVSDQDRALAFWTEKVGLRAATDQPMGAQRWIELLIPGAETGLVLFTPEGHEDRVGTFFNGSLACDDVEHAYRKLTEASSSMARRRSSPGGPSPSSRIRTATRSC